MTEFELKFQVDPQHRAAVESAVARGRSRQERLQARYYDTAEGALAARRIVLRIRKEGRRWVQTAKAPGDNALHRLEHNVDLPTGRASETPLPRLERHAGTPIGDLIAQALEAAGLAPGDALLLPLYGTDIRRTTREMRTGDARVELAFDRGEVRAGERTHPVCELEIELKSGSPQSLLELARRWRMRYPLWLDTVSKAQRGERLAKGIVHGDPVKAEAPSLGRNATAPQAFRAVLGACLAQILPNAAEVAAGSPDPEHVHQLRIGIRRLRTALREMRDFVPAPDPGWEPALVHAFRALGRQRDREHLEKAVQPEIEAAGGPPVHWPAPAEPEPAPAEVVREPAFQLALIGLIAASLPAQAQASPEAAEPDGPARKPLRARLNKLHRQIVRDGRHFEALEPEAQHRVRKRLKRLRYLGEFVAPLFGENAADRYLKALKPAQDALGKHNDAAVAMDAYRAAAGEDGRAWFAVGWLAARQPQSAQECRAALDELAQARRFWKS